MYHTFSEQMPAETKIDKEITKELISGKEFHKIHYTVLLPNNVKMHMFMYSRLFGKRDFTLSIIYVDEVTGKLMLNAFKNSEFK
jgi:hypothetical protein